MSVYLSFHMVNGHHGEKKVLTCYVCLEVNLYVLVLSMFVFVYVDNSSNHTIQPKSLNLQLTILYNVSVNWKSTYSKIKKSIIFALKQD